MTLSIQPLQKALNSLEAALTPPPRNDRERDGAIQRFEYTFELSWKMIRRYFIEQGHSDLSVSPKPLLRKAHEAGLIDDIGAWFGFLEARNHLTHMYDEGEADRIFLSVQIFPQYCRSLLEKLK